MAYTTFAAIDIGSYEVEMVIYEISSKGIHELDHVRHIIALGRDTYNSGSISYSLVDEVCDVLFDFCNIMKTYGVNNYRAFATSAIREAKNSRNIIDRIRVRTGLRVEILSNSEQRLIMYEAVASKEAGFSSLIENGAAMADVGGGSAQISIFNNGSLITTQNIQLGALRVYEFMSHITINSTNNLAILEEYIDTDVDALKHLFIKDRVIDNLILVGDAINWLIKSIEQYGYIKKNSYSREEFLELYHQIYLRGFTQDQADLILPTVMIYKKLLDATDAKNLWIPGVKLCDGIAAEFAGRDRKTSPFDHDFNADIVAAAKNISKRYSWNKEHIKLVEKNALAIFDVMKKYHGLGKRERILLQIACILHDCGQYISMLHPAECSYNIIMSTEIIGLSHLEREIVANIVKYTTEEFNGDNELSEFTDETFLLISKLTAIIKLSNSLDRGHKQKFRETKFQINNRNLEIITKTYEDLTLERSLITGTLFEQVYGIKPIIVQRHI